MIVTDKYYVIFDKLNEKYLCFKTCSCDKDTSLYDVYEDISDDLIFDNIIKFSTFEHAVIYIKKLFKEKQINFQKNHIKQVNLCIKEIKCTLDIIERKE